MSTERQVILITPATDIPESPARVPWKPKGLSGWLSTSKGKYLSLFTWKAPEEFLDQSKKAKIGFPTCSVRSQMFLRTCVDVNSNVFHHKNVRETFVSCQVSKALVHLSRDK